MALTNQQIFLCLLAAAMFGLGTFMLFRHRTFVSSSQRVREYEVAGRRYMIKGRALSDCSWCHRAGREVWVYFQSDQPANGKLVGSWEGWLFLVPILLAIYVAVIAFIGKP